MTDRKRLYVLDDDAALLEVLADLLDHAGFAVEVSTSGAQALRRMEEAAPDALVIDSALGDMSGLELVRRARAIRRPLPVVLLTGRTLPPDPAAEFDVVLRKPRDCDHLVPALRRLLS